MVGMSKAKAENRALPKRFYEVALAAPSGATFSACASTGPAPAGAAHAPPDAAIRTNRRTTTPSRRMMASTSAPPMNAA